jgi:hypothetical protein
MIIEFFSHPVYSGSWLKLHMDDHHFFYIFVWMKNPLWLHQQIPLKGQKKKGKCYTP